MPKGTGFPAIQVFNQALVTAASDAISRSLPVKRVNLGRGQSANSMATATISIPMSAITAENAILRANARGPLHEYDIIKMKSVRDKTAPVPPYTPGLSIVVTATAITPAERAATSVCV